MALFNAGPASPVLKQNIFGGWGKCVVVAEVEREPRNNSYDEAVDEDEIELCSQPEPEDIPEMNFQIPATPSSASDGTRALVVESPQPPPLSQEHEEDCHPTPPPAARRPASSLLSKPVPTRAKQVKRTGGLFKPQSFAPIAKGKANNTATPQSPRPRLTPS